MDFSGGIYRLCLLVISPSLVAGCRNTGRTSRDPAVSDQQPPSVPTGLVATVISTTQINLTWNVSTDNVAVTGYWVYVNDVGSSITDLPSFQHQGLTPGTTYTYRVSSYDAASNDSAWTAVVAATTPSAQTRDPLKWPFVSTSPWNMPIGTGASFAASGLHFTTTPNATEYWYDMPQTDSERIILTPGAPLTDVYINTTGWSGGDRCVQQGALFFQAPIPAAYVVPNSTNNNGAAILMADGKTITQTQPFTRCAGYSHATSLQVPWSISAWQYDIKTEDGRLGAHGGSQHQQQSKHDWRRRNAVAAPRAGVSITLRPWSIGASKVATPGRILSMRS